MKNSKVRFPIYNSVLFVSIIPSYRMKYGIVIGKTFQCIKNLLLTKTVVIGFHLMRNHMCHN